MPVFPGLRFSLAETYADDLGLSIRQFSSRLSAPEYALRKVSPPAASTVVRLSTAADSELPPACDTERGRRPPPASALSPITGDDNDTP